MKTFLIVIGCIFLYTFGAFITFVLSLYCDRCLFESSIVYDDIDFGHLGIALGWPLAIWFVLGYLLCLKLKKYAIAMTEVLYQMNHKENMEKKEQEKEVDAAARDVTKECYDKLFRFLKGDESEIADESCPYRCIDCKYFDDSSYYDNNIINISACVAGRCIKCQRNLVTSDPYNQIPSWCPLKGDKE